MLGSLEWPGLKDIRVHDEYLSRIARRTARPMATWGGLLLFQSTYRPAFYAIAYVQRLGNGVAMEPKTWLYRCFKGSKWQLIRAVQAQRYQLTAYRVLLTRAHWKLEEGQGQYLIDSRYRTQPDFIRETSGTDWMDPAWTQLGQRNGLNFQRTPEFPFGQVCAFVNGWTPEAGSASLVAESVTVEAYLQLASLPGEGESAAYHVLALCDRSGTYAGWNEEISRREKRN